MIRIAHISDLHFSRFSLSPAQFFSKRWLGNLNLLFNRAKDYINERPFSLIPTFKEKGVTHVIISGDLTTTSSREEYRLAKKFVDALKQEGMLVFMVPGNHDHYTKKADRTKTFYQSFPSSELSAHGITSLPLTEGWHLVLMDTSYASPLRSSNGFFSPTIEQNLKTALAKIDPGENILLVNHFPFFQHDTPRRRLIRGEKLQSLLHTYPNVQLYLHGHTHRRTLADLRENGLPLILDSGSTGHQKGSWNQLDLTSQKLKLTVHQWNDQWQATDHHTFTFKNIPWYQKGLRFKCTGCGKCCTGDGYVWLEEEDIQNLATHLNLSEEGFLKRYTRQIGFDIALLDDPNSEDCIFLKDKKLCEVYENRPKQCRTFPWWPQNLENPLEWEAAKKNCEGIDHEEAPLIPFSEIQKGLE